MYVHVHTMFLLCTTMYVHTFIHTLITHFFWEVHTYRYACYILYYILTLHTQIYKHYTVCTSLETCTTCYIRTYIILTFYTYLYLHEETSFIQDLPKYSVILFNYYYWTALSLSIPTYTKTLIFFQDLP